MGINTFENKVLQGVVRKVLEPIHEVDFKNFSYRFCPGRSGHYSIWHMYKEVVSKGILYLLNTDLKNYFGSVSHGLLMKGRPLEDLRKQNNMEASIFQLGFPLRNDKSKYRGHIKQKTWMYCRCLWINLIRILTLLNKYQRTFKAIKIPAQNPFSQVIFTYRSGYNQFGVEHIPLYYFINCN